MIQNVLILICLSLSASLVTKASATMSADVASSIQRLHAMMPIRFLITRQISVLSTGAAFAVRSQLTSEVKELQQRDFPNAERSWKMLASRLAKLEALLPDAEERRYLKNVLDEISEFNFGALNQTESRSVANCQRAREILVRSETLSTDLEGLTMVPGKLEAFDGTTELRARCEALIKEALLKTLG